MKEDFFVERGDQIICNWEEVIVYVPKSYFDSNNATFMGEKLSTFCILNIEAKKTATSKPLLFLLNLPVKLEVRYDEVIDVTKSFNGEEEEKFVGLKLKKDTVFIDNVNHVESLKDAIAFIDYFNSGKFRTDSPFTEVAETFKNALTANGVNTGISNALLEGMIGEICRYKENPDIPIHMIAGKTGKTDNYIFYSVKEMAENSSVFAALSFENINKAIRTSITKTKKGGVQYASPLETVIKY